MRDWVIVGALLLASLLVLLNKNEPVVRQFRAFALDGTARIETGLSWAGTFIRAAQENEALRATNIDLASELAQRREAVIENEQLRGMLGMRDTTDMDMLPTRIVRKDFTRQQNNFIINVGRADSVKPNMAVVTPEGILGKTTVVGDSYTEVQSYFSTSFSVPVKIQALQTAGVLRYEGRTDDRARLLVELIPRTEPVERGQLVVTSGFSSIFPPGYPIGYVNEVRLKPGQNELMVYVTPSATLSRAIYAFVILTEPDPIVLEPPESPEAANAAGPGG